ncbi:MAG: 2-octaprenyl-6-methoxyphenyl hydroxylase [Gammaproteobacteria bacterium]|nr:2-octaprenyl-6-methoxyphenyl hydroxylase [Gammaproteobacteria bacterium]
MLNSLQYDYDIVIIGGGLVGASLAAALGPSDLKVLVVEAIELNSEIQPSYDERTVALTHSAKLIYTGIGIWNSIASQQSEPIKDIHISNAGHFGKTHLSHKHVGTDALGYVVPTRVLGQVLWEKMRQSNNIDIMTPANAVSTTPIKGGHAIDIQLASAQETHRVKTKLLVVADGGRSAITAQLDIPRDASPYENAAVLSIMSSDKDHGNRAYERFTSEGPLALLPNGKKTYAMVWTTHIDDLERKMGLSDDAFIKELQAVFGDKAGNFSRPSARNYYPLSHGVVNNPISNHAVIVGNAAHTVHPVAGQGFNLGLRDVAALAETIHDHRQSQTLGSSDMLNQYSQNRQRDTRMVSWFTHGLIALFSNDFFIPALGRNLGLKSIELFPLAKRFLLKKTMGLAGKQSKLAMGIPLD